MTPPASSPAPVAPVARREPVTIEQLGRTRADDYAWMRDENWQRVLRDPAVLRADIRAHLEAENAYTDAVLAGTADDQAALFAAMRGRILEIDSSVPSPDGPWEYFVRYAEGAQQPVHARRRRAVFSCAPEARVGDEAPGGVEAQGGSEAAGAPEAWGGHEAPGQGEASGRLGAPGGDEFRGPADAAKRQAGGEHGASGEQETPGGHDPRGRPASPGDNEKTGAPDPGGEQVLLDCEALARDSAYFQLGSAHHSPDHALYAAAEDRQGSEVYRVLVRRVADGAPVGDPIENTTGNFTFSPCGRFLFWTFRDDNGRPARIFRRPVGGAASDDVLVYHEPDEGMFIGVECTASRRWVVIGSGNQETSEAHLIPADDIEAAPRVFAPREAGVRYDLEHWDDRFVIRTNVDGAVDFKLAAVGDAAPERWGRAHWQDLLPHRPGRFVVAIAAFRDHLVRVERVDADDRIVITARANGTERVVAGADDAYALSLGGGFEWATATLRYTHESPRQPRQTFDLDMATGQKTLRKTQRVPSGHDPAGYVVRRLHARAPDGAEVPITLLARADALAAGPCPTLLYGYGAYGIPMQPRFSVVSLGLVDRGWIWATAHIRGGSEKGWNWFLDGRGAQKPNTFTDFIAAAEILVAQGLAAPGAIVAHGASAGGMLMGAVANLRPDLWAGIAAGVPFVDVLNTMSDATLPLTPPEWPEWGNPIEDAAAYDRIHAYSPYDQVAPKPYPPILALGGLSDPRVTYWEPAKWIARLRARTTADAPLLLRINMEAGHGGASGRFDHLKEPALIQAFALWAEGRRRHGALPQTPPGAGAPGPA